MNKIISLLIMILFSEIIWYVCFKNQQQTTEAWTPPMPQVSFTDPFMQEDLQKLALEAQFGGSKEAKLFGQALLGQGFYSHAEHAFRRAVKLNDNDLESWFALGFCLDRTGRIETSNEIYEKLLPRLSEKDHTQLLFMTRYSLGRNALRLEKPDKALEIFRTMQHDPAGEYQLAKLLIRSGKVEEALEIIKHNLEKIPYSLEFHSLHQRALDKSGQEKEAIQAAFMIERSAALIDLNFNTVYITPFSKLTGLNRLFNNHPAFENPEEPQLAIKPLVVLWNKVKNLRHPLKETVLTEMGRVAGMLGDPKGIESCLKQLTLIGIKGPVVLNLEARLNELNNQQAEAVAILIRMHQMQPSPQLTKVLANWYQSQKENSKSDYYKAETLLLEGIQQYRSNKLEQAYESLKKANEFNPEQSRAWYYRSLIAFFLHKNSESQQACENCLKHSPYTGKARDILKVLN